jgi:Flp pilus assembly pilin Flp
MKLNHNIVNNHKGQTAVEYILLIAVIVVVMTTVFKKLEQYIVSNPDSLQANFIKNFENGVSGYNGDFKGKYQRFIIRR